MATEHTPEQRRQMSEAVKGKRVESLEWVEDGGGNRYWVMTFDGGGELCFRLMSELYEG
jgi:hypothetical protein